MGPAVDDYEARRTVLDAKADPQVSVASTKTLDACYGWGKRFWRDLSQSNSTHLWSAHEDMGSRWMLPSGSSFAC